MDVELDALCPLTLSSILCRTVLAVFLGGLVGTERGIKNRPAGMRTYMLVALGACMVMMTNQYVAQAYHTGDPVRLGAQVVSGIGFLGAGTIVVTKHNQIKGLTTAAGLWAAAGVGLAVGIGLYEVAVSGAILIFLILTALQRVDAAMRKNTKTLEVYIELKPHISLGEALRSIRAENIQIGDVLLEHENGSPEGCAALIATLRRQRGVPRQTLLLSLRKLDAVAYVEEL